jgi:hypothetical protein
MDRDVTILRPEERPWGALAHAFGLLPVWCLFFNIAMLIYFKDSSRRLAIHFQQSLMAHGVFLVLGAAWVVMQILSALTGAVAPRVGAALGTLNIVILGAGYSAYALVALYGAWRTFSGQPFLYPVIGQRVLAGAISKPTISE